MVCVNYRKKLELLEAIGLAMALRSRGDMSSPRAAGDRAHEADFRAAVLDIRVSPMAQENFEKVSKLRDAYNNFEGLLDSFDKQSSIYEYLKTTLERFPKAVNMLKDDLNRKYDSHRLELGLETGVMVPSFEELCYAYGVDLVESV